MKLLQKHPNLAVSWPDVESFSVPRSSRTGGYGRQNRLPSMKVMRTVRAASNLEMRFLTAWEIDPSVAYFCEQPFRFQYLHCGLKRRYTPDALLAGAAGYFTLVEVKYEEDAAAKENEERWLSIASASNSAGFGFQVVTERHLAAIEKAVLDVYMDRHAPRPTDDQLRHLRKSFAEPTAAVDIERLVGLSSAQVKSLIRRQVLRYTERIAPYSDRLLLQAVDPRVLRIGH